MAIFVLSTTMTRPITLPLMHARGVIMWILPIATCQWRHFLLNVIYCTCRYNGRPLSGARVTTCWLDHKNMKELGITEDMIYSEGKNDSYEKNGGKRMWMGRYQGGRKKIASRERESSSSGRYDNEPSKSVSSPGYKTRVMSHVDISSSVIGTSLPRISTEAKSKESKEYPSSTEERLSFQASDSNNQGREVRSVSKSLSQNSTESIHISGKKRHLTLGDGINIQPHPKKLHESESGDSVCNEKGKLKDYSLKRKGQLVDRNRGSPPRRVDDYSDGEKPKEDRKCSPGSESASLCPSPLKSEGNTSVSAATQVEDRIHSVNPIPELHIVQQEPLQRIDLDYNQVESQASAQLDAHQTERETQSSCTDMSCTPSISAFDFERDETPPAEIVEATAEWYRTQNFPENLSSVSLQHVFQYYKSSMAVDGTNDSNEGGVWHSPIWHGRFQRGGQPLEESFAGTCMSSNVTNTEYCYSNQSAFYATLQNVNPTGERSSNAHIHSSVHSKPVSKKLKEANQHVATVLPEEPTCSYLACEQLTSHSHSAIDGDHHQLSDGEIQEHLKVFLTKQEAEATEHSFDSENVPTSGTQAGVESTLGLTRSTGSGQVNHIVRHCCQQGKEVSACNLELPSPYHSRDQNIYTAPENYESSYLTTTTVKESVLHQGGNQRLSQNSSSPFNEHIPVPMETKDYKQVVTRDGLFPLSYAATVDSVAERTASISEDFHHKYNGERSEPSRYQWKECKLKLNESQQPSNRGLWRIEELGYVQEPLTREREDNSMETTPFVVHACSPLNLCLAARGGVQSGGTSTSTFSSQISLDSVTQPSSQTSPMYNKMSCIHEEKVGRSRLRQPTIRESYQYDNPSRDHHRQANLVDLPSSCYQHTDVDKLRVSSLKFHSLRGPPQQLNTDILPNRPVLRSVVHKPLQEIYQPDENETEKYDIFCVPQRTLNDTKKDQPRRLLQEELAAINSNMDDNAEEVSNNQILDAHKPTRTEQTLRVRRNDTAQISVADVQALQTMKQKPVADEYKHLQKCYYKVQ